MKWILYSEGDFRVTVWALSVQFRGVSEDALFPLFYVCGVFGEVEHFAFL